MTRIKICGITNMEDALAAIACGAHALGFVFASSPRRVTPEQAGAIVRALPPFVTAVAVVVDEPVEALRGKLETSGCQAVQLHGDEPPSYVDNLRGSNNTSVSCHSAGLSEPRFLAPLGMTPMPWIIKAFRIGDEGDLGRLDAYGRADAFLLDSRVAGKAGGSGVTFDWGLAQTAGKTGKPIILAGGLTPDNVGAALEAARPYAVDVSSGVEVSPGRKDHGLMREFVRAVREFDARQA
jgi:phosphoribosylanthranilate isomerase